MDLTKTNAKGKTVLEYLRDGPSMSQIDPKKNMDYLAVINTLLLHGAPEIDIKSLKDHYVFDQLGPGSWMAALVLMTGAKSLDPNLIEMEPGMTERIKYTADLVENYAAQREAALASMYEIKSPRQD